MYICHSSCFYYYFLKLEIITKFIFSYKLFFSGLSNTFTGKSNHHCHVSAYEKSFPIKPVPSPSWSGSCRRSILSPKKIQRRHFSTAEEVRKSCSHRCEEQLEPFMQWAICCSHPYTYEPLYLPNPVCAFSPIITVWNFALSPKMLEELYFPTVFCSHC